MSEMHEVHRHSDGSIDMTFYKARAHALRRAQIAQMGRASRRHILQLLTEFADLIRPDRYRQAAMQPSVVRRGVRQNRK
jgi:hypothetical protein